MKKLFSLILVMFMLVTLIACAEPVITVSFETNGGQRLDPIEVIAGESAQLPNPSREGYNFDTWYVDPNFAVRANPSRMPEEDITLYARWQINRYTLDFDSTGGSRVQSVTADFNSNLTTPRPPNRIGHDFIGWYKDSSFNEPFVFSTMPAVDTTIYARWEAQSFLVNYFDFSTIEMTAFGGGHSVATTSDNRLFTLGDNSLGQLGNQTDLSSPSPVFVKSLSGDENFISIDAGWVHSGALTSKGRLLMWGYNVDGQLGDGTFLNRDVPIDISMYFNLEPNEKIIEISLGRFHSLALTSLGRLFSWGDNLWGQIGVDEEIVFSSENPLDITSAFRLNPNETIVLIEAGDNHNGVITSNGRIFTWGQNVWGQLGFDDDVLFYSSEPLDITESLNLSSNEIIIDLTFGFVHSMALTSEGRVLAWGSHGAGQLGLGAISDEIFYTHEPIEISLFFGLSSAESVIAIEAGRSHNLALTSGGRLLSWGYNEYGQVGDRSTENRFSPRNITSQINFRQVERILVLNLGENVSSVITSEGRLLVWGQNTYGQIGNNTYTDRITPLDITNNIETKTIKISESLVTFDTNIDLFVPEKENHTFIGWFLDENLTVPFEGEKMPAEDLNLYGKWIFD